MAQVNEIERINKLRKLRKVTIKELSEEIGMSVTGTQQLLKKNDIKTSLLKKIAHYFNVPVTYFFEDTSSPPEINEQKEDCVKWRLEAEKYKALYENEKKNLEDRISDLKMYIRIMENQLQEKTAIIADLRERVRDS